MTRLLILALSLVLCGCKPTHQEGPHALSSGTTSVASKVVATMTPKPDEPILCDNKPFSDEDLSNAALDVLFPHLTYFDGSYTPNAAQLGYARERLHKMEDFTAAIKDAKVQAAYNHWLDTYRREYDDIERVSREKAAGHNQAETEAARREEERRQADARRLELARCLPKPK